MSPVRKSRRAAISKSSKVITIQGRRLSKTAAFDDFWRFISERKAVDDKRRKGLPQPWTKDSVLDKYRFCNVFRLADRGSQFLIRHVIESGSQDITEVTFRVLLYNIFTRPDTYRLLEARLDSLTWATYKRTTYVSILRQAQKEGQSIYTGAFQKPAPRLGQNEAFGNHLYLLEVMMARRLPEWLSKCQDAQDAYEFLLSFSGMGNFLAFQLLLDLSYSPVVKFSCDNFVILGPGAISGLSKCFHSKGVLAGIESQVVLWMAETQGHHLKQLLLPLCQLDGRPMQAIDIEHSLCEWDKYVRFTQGQKKNVRGRAFYPSDPDDLAQVAVVIPKSWKHVTLPTSILQSSMARREPKKISKQFVIRGIKQKREFKGKIEYLVEWVGYDIGHATWEPEDTLQEDAPSAIQDYETMLSKKRSRV